MYRRIFQPGVIFGPSILALCQHNALVVFYTPESFIKLRPLWHRGGKPITALKDPLRCVWMKAENYSALPLFSCRSACSSLWVMWQVCCHSCSPREGIFPSAATFPSGSSQWRHLPNSTTATSLKWNSGKRTQGLWDRFSPYSWSWSNTTIQTQGSHRLLEEGQSGMGTQPHSSSELLSHAAVNMWWLFPCLLLASLQPYSVNFSEEHDE